jgi:hypothetical protein
MAHPRTEISGNRRTAAFVALVAGFAGSDAAETRLEYALLGCVATILLVGLWQQASEFRNGWWRLLWAIAG